MAEESSLARRLVDPTFAFGAVMLCAGYIAVTWLATTVESGRPPLENFGWVGPALAIFVGLLAVALRRGGIGCHSRTLSDQGAQCLTPQQCPAHRQTRVK